MSDEPWEDWVESGWSPQREYLYGEADEVTQRLATDPARTVPTVQVSGWQSEPILGAPLEDDRVQTAHTREADTPHGGRLGVVAFAVVVLMSLACVVLSHIGGRLTTTSMTSFSPSTFELTKVAAAAPALSDELSAIFGLGFICTLIGTSGWALSVVARLRGSAPRLALSAIITGLCTPFLSLIAFLAAVTP